MNPSTTLAGVTAVLAVFSGWMLLSPARAQTDNALPLETAAVESARAPLERIYDGTVEAVHQATMSAQTSGRIAAVFFDVDDYVESGEAIVQFTDTEQQSALRGAEAALAEALARQTQAEEDYRRISGLLESGTASKRDYDQALASETPRSRACPPRGPPSIQRSNNSNTRWFAHLMPESSQKDT